ncbi:CinA family protein [Acidithiobacillus sp. AMEEHan]|uniref:CinA family protein n=1 Tax=Acidithiobacillus sp. AMEEHan TaxID=2994951 RepID=UPI0027E44B1B|nr:CinA family protein [Acidithiobacillus sp. AMEEHan]
MNSEFPIYLPLRPAALPLAQRVATWIEWAGQPVRLSLCRELPLHSVQGVALGDFANAAAWQSAGGILLDPLDWSRLAEYLCRHWFLTAMPRTRFGVTPVDAPLPGEIWSGGGDGMALDLAPPEWALLRWAESRGWQLATAESCTAGGIAARIAALPGSSAVLRQGFVVYSNAAKEEMLGVAGKTLQVHGAVSEEVVGEMLDGALRHADLAIAVSGIAGPGGAVPGKPVGTVCLGWASRNQRELRTLCFAGDRWAVQYAAGSVAIGGLLGLLTESEHPKIGLYESLG